jgi:DNA modification methylase
VTIQLYCGDCLDILPTLEAASVDCVITDPPYPEMRVRSKRDYEMLGEAAWFDMMKSLVPEVRRVLKPQGSAMFILQPNSKKLGQMRVWLWEFMAWIGKEWGIVQDAYWWNTCAPTEAHSIQGRLMRPSLKYLVWCGPADCYRNQDAVLWEESK